MVTSRNTIGHSHGDRGARVMRAVLPPTAKIRMTRAGEDADLLINGHAVEVKWIGSGHLGDVHAALGKGKKRNVIFVARQMSPGARAVLSNAGISWADETGAAEIAIGTILISQGGSPPPKRYALTQWTPAVIAVAEAILCGTRGTQTAMQSATGLSAGSCASALRFLTEEQLLTSAAKRGPSSARRISDTMRLLDAYAAAANQRPPGLRLQIGVTWQDVLKGAAAIGRRLDDLNVVWAITGGAAAAVLAPFISSLSQATVYVDARTMAELRSLAVSLELRPIEGGRLALKPIPAGSVRQLITLADGLRLAPWPRVYADLLKEGVRGEEAAQHLYEVMNERRAS